MKRMEHQEDMTFDVSPYLKLFIDRDGRWFQNGKEIIHTGIYRLFNSLLEKTDDGGYQVRKGKEICRVEVEDAPFVVTGLEEEPGDGLSINLNDGSREHLDPEHLWIGQENIPYCMIKDREFRARFSRPAYYQLAEHVMEENGEFFLVIQDKRSPVKTKKAN